MNNNKIDLEIMTVYMAVEGGSMNIVVQGKDR
jgi:hypothetical protein